MIGYVTLTDPRASCLIILYEGKFRMADYYGDDWVDTHEEEDEVFVAFYPAKPIPRYDWSKSYDQAST